MSTTKIKGLCKGSFKYISHLFVKEREMEIGFPTDVKHVAHIGWDSPSGGTAPSWMNEFKASSDMVASVGSTGGSRDATWTSQDFEQTLGRQPSSARLSNFPPGNKPSIPRKQKRKKTKSTSSTPKSSSSARSSRSSSKFNSMIADSDESGSRHNVML